MAKKLGQRSNLVIATGGGVVLHPENVAALKRNGIIVGLEASPEAIMSRVSREKSNRPLLGKHTTVDDIEKMLAARGGILCLCRYQDQHHRSGFKQGGQ